jgi:hypothetical protein
MLIEAQPIQGHEAGRLRRAEPLTPSTWANGHYGAGAVPTARNQRTDGDPVRRLVNRVGAQPHAARCRLAYPSAWWRASAGDLWSAMSGRAGRRTRGAASGGHGYGGAPSRQRRGWVGVCVPSPSARPWGAGRPRGRHDRRRGTSVRPTLAAPGSVCSACPGRWRRLTRVPDPERPPEASSVWIRSWQGRREFDRREPPARSRREHMDPVHDGRASKKRWIIGD